MGSIFFEKNGILQRFFYFSIYIIILFIQGNMKLLSVFLPTSLVVISDYAFSNCNALQNVTIPTYVHTNIFSEQQLYPDRRRI